MMIDFGEAEVLERQVFELLKRVVGRGLAGANLFQKLFKAVKVHCFNVSLRAAPAHAPEADGLSSLAAANSSAQGSGDSSHISPAEWR